MDSPSAYEKTTAAAGKKLALLGTSPGRYAMQATLAGAYLTIIGFLYWSIRNSFGYANPTGQVISGLFFGVGLSVIIFTGAELFTSNNMYLTVATLERRNSWAATLRLWSVCWVFNFAGAIAVALLLAAAGSADLPSGHALFEGVHHKIEASSWHIFTKGILANWIVCLAVWVNNNLKEEIARLAAIILVVFIFLFLGFEHSIANMGYFAVAYLADPTLPLAGLGRDLLFATLGNIVGGAVGLGLTSWVVHRQPVAAFTAEARAR